VCSSLSLSSSNCLIGRGAVEAWHRPFRRVFSHMVYILPQLCCFIDQLAYMCDFVTGMVQKELLLPHMSRRHVEIELHYVASAEWPVGSISFWWTCCTRIRDIVIQLLGLLLSASYHASHWRSSVLNGVRKLAHFRRGGHRDYGRPWAFEKPQQYLAKATRLSARYIGLFDARILHFGRLAGRRQLNWKPYADQRANHIA
jgi:hypothetical protein